jgi:hypothetical protein
MARKAAFEYTPYLQYAVSEQHYCYLSLSFTSITLIIAAISSGDGSKERISSGKLS